MTGPGGRAAFAKLIFTGSMLVGCVALGLGLGYLADRAAGTTPLFIFVGLVLGIVAAGAGTYRAVRDYLNQ
ncbi:MAG: AtpZ/AtpI family protein [Frankiaceae bacterium]